MRESLYSRTWLREMRKTVGRNYCLPLRRKYKTEVCAMAGIVLDHEGIEPPTIITRKDTQQKTVIRIQKTRPLPISDKYSLPTDAKGYDFAEITRTDRKYYDRNPGIPRFLGRLAYSETASRKDSSLEVICGVTDTTGTLVKDLGTSYVIPDANLFQNHVSDKRQRETVAFSLVLQNAMSTILDLQATNTPDI